MYSFETPNVLLQCISLHVLFNAFMLSLKPYSPLNPSFGHKNLICRDCSRNPGLDSALGPNREWPSWNHEDGGSQSLMGAGQSSVAMY